MTRAAPASEIRMIEIDRINVLNPRARNKKILTEIAENIVQVGLKRPITVTPCKSQTPGKDYDLVCGQGRIEVFISAGQTEIPALIIEASEQEALVMSLVENLARRQHRASDLLQGIELLHQQGYDNRLIALKTGLSQEWVAGMVLLLERGEERLVSAVEGGHIPISLAIKIASSSDDEQQALHELYDSRQLRGKKLLKAKYLLAMRKRCGKTFRNVNGRKPPGSEIPMRSEDILRVYNKEVNRKRLLVRKAEAANNNLVFVTEAMRRLFRDGNFVTLLRAEGLTDLPKALSDWMSTKGQQNV